jgi:hypothetical protein
MDYVLYLRQKIFIRHFPVGVLSPAGNYCLTIHPRSKLLGIKEGAGFTCLLI